MKVTRTHKIYAVIVCLALAALCIDKLSGSSEANATAQLSELLQPALTSGANEADASASPAVDSLAANLKSLAGGRSFDADKLPDLFGQARRRAPATAAATTAAPASGEFLKGHVLSAIMQSTQGNLVIVNGRMLKVGDVIDGYRLQQIARGRAVFASSTTTIVLRIGIPSDNLAQLTP